MSAYRRSLVMSVFFVLLAFAGVFAAEMGAAEAPQKYDLVKDGAAKSAIVLNESLSTVEFFAALELADYLEKISGARPEIRRTPAKGLYNILLYTWEWRANQTKLFTELNLKNRFGKDVNKIKDDGYLISADADGLCIIGMEPIAVYYGVCDLLRDCGEVRWFFPGEDGEYCPKAPSFSVPAQRRICNPDFKKRNFSIAYAGVNLEPTVLWMLRNKMTPGRSYFNAMGSGRSLGGHIFSTLLPDTLYDEHPEYFCMDKDGKRIPQNGKVKKDPGKPRPLGGQANQPCTSNPEVVDIMCRNVVKMIGQADNVKSFTVLNNDNTAWCNCTNCVKLDPEAERSHNWVSTRFWLLNNELIKAIKTNYPKVEVCSSAYQNYQEFPKGVVPDPRCTILLWMHSRCYTHSLGDEKCLPNARFRRIIKEWSDAKMPVYPANYTDCQAGGTYLYQPLENILAKDNQYYKKMNCVGSTDFVAPKDAVFVKAYENPRHLTMWRANFMNYYVDAATKWDSTLDYSRIVDDVGAKFYGKAWPQFKAFRDLLRAAYEGADTHLCYGTPSMAQGKCLDNKATHQKLNELLAAALAAAAGDETVTARIKLEEQFFRGSWEENRAKLDKVITENAEALKVAGAPSEADWDKAKMVDDFKVFEKADVKAEPGATARALYDDNNIYLRIEAFVKDPSVLKKTMKKRDDIPWSDSTFELFFAPDAWAGKYLHFVVNPDGCIWDAMTVGPLNQDSGFNADADVKTAVMSDRWRADIRIAFKDLGGAPKPGEGMKINICRGNPSASWSAGEFHGRDVYRTVIFK